jgi:hypothetical protein
VVIRCARTLMLVVFLFAGFSFGTIMANASPAMPYNGIRAMLQDDGPLLPGDLTPDDDGDGVVDEHDSAPEDPNEGTAPEPGDTDPIADGDDDGLPNALDPDDDSDGVTDDDENMGGDNDPPAPVTNPTSPSEPGPDPAPEPETEPVFAEAVPSRTTTEHSVVLALPSTGSGGTTDRMLILGMLTGTNLLLAAAGGSLLTRRR